MVSEEEDSNCYNNSDGKPVHTNIEVELQLLPLKTNVILETCINPEHLINEPHPVRMSQSVTKSKRLPHEKQKLGSLLYQSINNRKNNWYTLCVTIMCTLVTIMCTEKPEQSTEDKQSRSEKQ